MIRKHFNYAFYVLRHKLQVFVECWRLGVPWRGLTHDLSKLRPAEWRGYANFFFGELCEQDLDALNLARLIHQHRNPHHRQHWRLLLDDGRECLLPMPEEYVREMVADWRSVERIKGRKSLAPWLRQHAGEVDVDLVTELRLEKLLSAEELAAWHEGRGRDHA